MTTVFARRQVSLLHPPVYSTIHHSHHLHVVARNRSRTDSSANRVQLHRGESTASNRAVDGSISSLSSSPKEDMASTYIASSAFTLELTAPIFLQTSFRSLRRSERFLCSWMVLKPPQEDTRLSSRRRTKCPPIRRATRDTLPVCSLVKA